ncbi:S16 family serine protease [Streptomyces qinglanensis]|uniref:S16 family serine protease n=1 Tax=Streptomyces qinglanensis TaxID=943816 RepID=UPI0009422BDF|nr:S16 family serine protease [Streptomyces qinglanensis]
MSASSTRAPGTEGPRRTRRRTLALCVLPVVLLFVVALAAPLPFSLAQPGETANVLGRSNGKPVITVEGAETHGSDKGRLLSVTIAATRPEATVRLPDLVRSWFRRDRAVMPRDAVYPGGGDTEDAEKRISAEMKDSQRNAVTAALRQLHRSPEKVRVKLRLGDVGGPSAGLFFALGIVDKLDGDGAGAGLTGGRTVAGTGTIDADGKVGPVGGVPLKTQAARRDGATWFLVPEEQCDDAGARLPSGLRLVPVGSLQGALDALEEIRTDGKVPAC